ISNIYIDGVKKTNNVNISSVGNIDNDLPFKIGSRALGSGSFRGQIDNVKIYNYARTTAQIAYDYNRGAPIAHYKFGECQGNIVHDESLNANHGTINIGEGGTQTSIGTC